MNAIAVGLAPPRDRALIKTSETLQVAHSRLMILMMVFALVTGVIGIRLLYLAVFNAPERSGAVAASGRRGDITDRNGVVLASMIKGISLALRPQRVISDRDKLAVELARLFPARPVDYYRRVLHSRRKFVYLERGATPGLIRATRLLGEPAIEEVPELERFYPQGSLAAQVVGYLDLEGKQPVSGMEAAANQQLTAGNGAPVALSIDSRVQAVVESALGAQMVKHSAVGAAGIVLDVHTGEILAMASLPSFNPNAPGRSPVSLDKRKPDARFNQAIKSVFELGSTFKMITVANAIEHGVITDMGHRYDATAPLQVGGYRIRDDHPQNRWLTTPEILIHSSNIGTARIADELGEARTSAFFRQLGFDRPVDIELRGAAKPIWPGFWARTTVMTTAYGHGIAVTPLHLANAYAALVNGGIFRPATMYKRAPGQVAQGRRVISEATSARMRQMMRLVVMPGFGGTGRNADAAGLRVGGKTGTAEKNLDGRYVRDSLLVTFAAVFPMDNPRYVVIGTLDEPHGTKDTYGFRTAAWTVAPAIKKIISRMGPLLGVIPDDRRDLDVSDLVPYIQLDEKAGHVAD